MKSKSLIIYLVILLPIIWFNNSKSFAKCEVEISKGQKSALIEKLNNESFKPLLLTVDIATPLNSDDFENSYQPGNPLSYDHLLKLRRAINKKFLSPTIPMDEIKALESLRMTTWPLFDALQNSPECLKQATSSPTHHKSADADMTVSLAEVAAHEKSTQSDTPADACLLRKPFPLPQNLTKSTEDFRLKTYQLNKTRRSILVRNSGPTFKAKTFDSAQIAKAHREQNILRTRICAKMDLTKCSKILDVMAEKPDAEEFASNTFDQNQDMRVAVLGEENSSTRKNFQEYRMWHSRLLLFQMESFDNKLKENEPRLVEAKNFAAQETAVTNIYNSLIGPSNTWIYDNSLNPALYLEGKKLSSNYFELKTHMDEDLTACRQSPVSDTGAVSDASDAL